MQTARFLLLLHLAWQDVNISGPKGPRSTRGNEIYSMHVIDFQTLYINCTSCRGSFGFFPLSDIMDLRHQSSTMCIIMLGGKDTHPRSATKVGKRKKGHLVVKISERFDIFTFYILTLSQHDSN